MNNLITQYRRTKIARELAIAAAYKSLIDNGAMKMVAIQKIRERFEIASDATVYAILKRVSLREAENQVA